MMCWKKLFFNQKTFLLVFASLFLSFENNSSLSAHETSVSGTNEIQGGNFTLNSTEGPLSLKDLRGSVVLLFFGYTSCPSVCPISLATISSAFSKMLPADLKRTKALFISLDPERDDVEVLKQYTGYFHPNILGLTEDITVVIKVAEQYGIKYKKTLVPDSALGYVISHSSDIVVLGLDGKLRRTFPHDTSATPLKEHIIYLLDENL
jgi:protein SCO1/2